MFLDVFDLPLERLPVRRALLYGGLRQFQVVSLVDLLGLYSGRRRRLRRLEESQEAGGLVGKRCKNGTYITQFLVLTLSGINITIY